MITNKTKLFLFIHLIIIHLIVVSIAVPLFGFGAKYQVTKGEFVKTVILTGSLKAQKAERFVVPPTNTWRLQLKWMAPEGELVKKGDPVVRFDTSNIVTDIESREISLLNKQDERARKRAEARNLEYEHNTTIKQKQLEYEKLKLDAAVPRGIVSNYDYDKNQLNLKRGGQALEQAKIEKRVRLASMKADLEKLDIEIQQEKERLQKLQEQLESLTLNASSDGIIVWGEHRWDRRKIQIGDTVYSTWTVATIPDDNSLLVEAWVSENHINHIATGQTVVLKLDAYPGKEFEGTVKDVLNTAQQRPKWGKSHYFRVMIEPGKIDHTIMKTGMSVQCAVTVIRRSDVLLVPFEAAYSHNGHFWFKPGGKEARAVKIIGFNEFRVAIEPGTDPAVEEGARLEPVKPGDIMEKPNEKE